MALAGETNKIYIRARYAKASDQFFWLKSRNGGKHKGNEFRRLAKSGGKINVNQAKNIDQADKINQTIEIIVLSKVATVKVEKTKVL